MSEEIIKYGSDLEQVAQVSEQYKELLDDWMSEHLNKKVNPKAVKKLHGNSYIPISILESALDSIYMGLWQTKNVKIEVQVNSVVCTLELHVFHPIVKQWIIRIGVGAVPIQVSKETKELLPMALQKNAPSAAALAFKNAVKSLGRRFGRNLNRNEDFDYMPSESPFTILFKNDEQND